MQTERWDAVVIGTGFGGSMTAYKLVEAGLSVLILERGNWVERDDTAWDPTAILLDQKYKGSTPYEANQWLGRKLLYPNEVVGGSSVFYGAASFRLREQDFHPEERFSSGVREHSGGAEWPINYTDLAPYYDHVEELLDVHGVAGLDPKEPPRSGGYRAAPPPYSSPAQRVVTAGESLGLRPFPIPLAINFGGSSDRTQCIQCMTCDLFPCKIGAKNDLSITLLPEAEQHGAVIQTHTVATKLVRDGNRISAVECIDTETGQTMRVECAICVVSCGAIESPRLLLASGLNEVKYNGPLIGRYLMRHCSGIVMAVFPDVTNPKKVFHKQVAFTDFYDGHPEGHDPAGPWGMIQGLQVPPPEYIAKAAPFPIGFIGSVSAKFHIYLLCLAEDAPNGDNRVELERKKVDKFGRPIAKVFHKYLERDLQARRALYRQAARILKKAGARFRVRKPINTFSHALGSCRFGNDPATAVLDPYCRFFGVANLFVVDASFMPTSGGVNPSLTIAANALRVGDYLVNSWQSLT